MADAAGDQSAEAMERLSLMEPGVPSASTSTQRLGRRLVAGVALGLGVAATVAVKASRSPLQEFEVCDSDSLTSLAERLPQDLDLDTRDADALKEYVVMHQQQRMAMARNFETVDEGLKHAGLEDEETTNAVRKALSMKDPKQKQQILRRAMNRAVEHTVQERRKLQAFLQKRQLAKDGKRKAKLLDFLGKNEPPAPLAWKEDEPKMHAFEKHAAEGEVVQEGKPSGPPAMKLLDLVGAHAKDAWHQTPGAEEEGAEDAAAPMADDIVARLSKLSGDPSVMPISLDIKKSDSWNQDGTRGWAGSMDPNQNIKSSFFSNTTEVDERSKRQGNPLLFKRAPQQQAQVASCVFNVLSVTNSFATTAANFNDAIKTCSGVKVKYLVSSGRRDIHAKVCSINAAAVFGTMVGMASSLSLAADNCAATLIPNIEAICAGGIFGLFLVIGQIWGGLSIIKAACFAKGWYHLIPKGVVPSNVGSNEMYKDYDPESYKHDRRLLQNQTLVDETLAAIQAHVANTLPELKMAKEQAATLKMMGELGQTLFGGLNDAPAEAEEEEEEEYQVEAQPVAPVPAGQLEAAPADETGAAEEAEEPVALVPANEPAPALAAPAAEGAGGGEDGAAFLEPLPMTPETHSPSAPARKLLFGGGKGSTATLCALEIQGIMWNLASAGLAINAAANPNNGASCPPVNLMGEKNPDYKGFIYRINQGFCLSDISGTIVAFAGAIGAMLLVAVNCVDELNLDAICGAGIDALLGSMAGVCQVAVAMWLTCDEFNIPIIKKAIKLLTKIDDASGGAISDLIAGGTGGDSLSESFGRRLSDKLTHVKEDMKRTHFFDDESDVFNIRERFGTPEKVWEHLGYNLSDTNAWWRQPAAHGLGAMPADSKELESLFEEKAETRAADFLGRASTCSK